MRRHIFQAMVSRFNNILPLYNRVNNFSISHFASGGNFGQDEGYRSYFTAHATRGLFGSLQSKMLERYLHKIEEYTHSHIVEEFDLEGIIQQYLVEKKQDMKDRLGSFYQDYREMSKACLGKEKLEFLSNSLAKEQIFPFKEQEFQKFAQNNSADMTSYLRTILRLHRFLEPNLFTDTIRELGSVAQELVRREKLIYEAIAYSYDPQLIEFFMQNDLIDHASLSEETIKAMKPFFVILPKEEIEGFLNKLMNSGNLNKDLWKDLWNDISHYSGISNNFPIWLEDSEKGKTNWLLRVRRSEIIKENIPEQSKPEQSKLEKLLKERQKILTGQSI